MTDDEKRRDEKLDHFLEAQRTVRRPVIHLAAPRRFQFSLGRLLAAMTTAAVALAFLIYGRPLDAMPINQSRFFSLLLRVFVFSLLVGVAVGLVACQRPKTILIVVFACGCIGAAFDIFLYWLATELSHQ